MGDEVKGRTQESEVMMMEFKPDGDRQERRYAFLVVIDPGGRVSPYSKGQILTCEVDLDGGGIPIEVGTLVKPGKVDCQIKRFDLWTEAINFSYAVVDDRIDEEGNEIPARKKKRHDGGKKWRKYRHTA